MLLPARRLIAAATMLLLTGAMALADNNVFTCSS
jgi:hypothetical protein